MVADYLVKSCDTFEFDLRIITTPNSYTNKLLFDDLDSNHNV